jgi:uncharacterized protein YbjT (DUF2867 family)
VAVPVGDVREPFVDADDIADVAVAALTDDRHEGRHEGRVYELTGPRALGRPARDFTEYARDAAASGVWKD